MELILSSLKVFKNELIKHFLNVNSDFNLFVQIEWVENSCMGTAEISFDEIRSGNWQVILDYLNEIKKSTFIYAKYKSFVMGNIDFYKKERKPKIVIDL